jgi:hypothetical protein
MTRGGARLAYFWALPDYILRRQQVQQRIALGRRRQGWREAAFRAQHKMPPFNACGKPRLPGALDQVLQDALAHHLVSPFALAEND